MTRFVSETNAAEALEPSIIMTLLVDIDFASGNLYAHEGTGTISFQGNDYIGVGKLGAVDGSVQDSLDVIARPITLTISGVDSALVNSAMTEDYQGRSVTIYLAFISRATGALIASPEVTWEGRMDYMEIDLSAGGGSIKINCEHRLRREPRIARFTSEDQQINYPTDQFFGMVPFIQGFKAQWGDHPSQYGGGQGGSFDRSPGRVPNANR